MKQSYLALDVYIDDIKEKISYQGEEFIADFIIELLGSLKAKTMENTIDYLNYNMCDEIKKEILTRITIGENK